MVCHSLSGKTLKAYRVKELATVLMGTPCSSVGTGPTLPFMKYAILHSVSLSISSIVSDYQT
jgi:hypothetical protein